MTPKAISRSIKELTGEIEDHPDRQRSPGGGRKAIAKTHPELLDAFDKLVAPHTSGDPMSPLRWTCKSTYKLAQEINSQGFSISANTVSILLKQDGYSLQGTRKRFECKQHPDRNAQFEYIASAHKSFREGPVL